MVSHKIVKLQRILTSSALEQEKHNFRIKKKF